MITLEYRKENVEIDSSLHNESDRLALFGLRRKQDVIGFY